MPYYYTNEIVFRGHPDKVADQISDALLDAYLEQDKNSRCGIEVVGGKDKIFITGEVTSTATVDVEAVVKYVLRDIGYRDDYEIINNLGKQSPDIAQGVDIGGAGDQGMMFGYACRETAQHLPKAMVILQELSRFYDMLRRSDDRFLPDGKAQITGVYNDDGKLVEIKDFTISYQNTEVERFDTDKILIDSATKICHEYGIDNIESFHINPTGKFLIGGFDGDAGLTGRKIVVDSYQSFANVGGGALSGKDPSKVDRSAAYKARQIAIRYLNQHHDIEWALVQLSYTIGMDMPMAIYINTNKGMADDIHDGLYDECKPRNIIKDLHLNSTEVLMARKWRNLKYYETAKFGHFGNKFFPWEVE